ncbi:MAG: hypothetical protein R2806_10440 [Saprospiraceae bacterium]
MNAVATLGEDNPERSLPAHADLGKDELLLTLDGVFITGDAVYDGFSSLNRSHDLLKGFQ